MKILLTGANGFVGRHLLPKLIQAGHEVTAVVRHKGKLIGCDGVTSIIELDIFDMDNHSIMLLSQADALIHLAWGGLPNYRSMQHIDIQLPNHYQFIKTMIKAGISHISVVGSCFEYGMQSGQLDEKMHTLPDNPYGFAKDTLRKQLELLRLENNFNLNWMRLFYMYGNDQPANTLYSQLRAAVDKNDRVFNMSGGEQLRDYLHIDDVVDRMLKLVVKNENIGVVNVCSGRPISVRCLVEQWKKLNEWDIPLNLGYYPYPDYEPFAFWGDNEKYQRLTGSDK